MFVHDLNSFSSNKICFLKRHQFVHFYLHALIFNQNDFKEVGIYALILSQETGVLQRGETDPSWIRTSATDWLL